MARVGLVMIVRDEEANIRRALESAKPWISTWVICDTGSQDRTKEIIHEVMADVSGLLVDRPWVSFEVNRTEALELCRDRMDWAIMLDADDNLAGTVPPAELWTELGDRVDGMSITLHHGTIVHQRVQIFRTTADWCYKGAVHEAPACRTREPPRIAMLPAKSYMVTRCEGFRSKDPDKYIKDACLLESTFWKDRTNTRALFYLAQSWRDAGVNDQAMRYYRMYIDGSGGWDMERYMAYVNVIQLTPNLDEKLQLAWRAVEVCPQRLEAPYSVLQAWRQAERPPTQQLYALGAIVTNRVCESRFIFSNPATYTWMYDDEFAAVAFHTGHYQVSYEASMRLALNGPTSEVRENALSNARLCKEKLSTA